MLLAGMAWTRAKSVTAYSAMPPGAVAMTRSPGFRPATSLPTASISPAHSSPMRAPTPPTAPCRWPEATMRSARLSVEATPGSAPRWVWGQAFPDRELRPRRRPEQRLSCRLLQNLTRRARERVALGQSARRPQAWSPTRLGDANQSGRAAISAARPFSRRQALGLQGGEIGCCVQDILLIELADDGRHQRCPGAGPIAVLHVVELAPEIARGAAR